MAPYRQAQEQTDICCRLAAAPPRVSLRRWPAHRGPFSGTCGRKASLGLSQAAGRALLKRCMWPIAAARGTCLTAHIDAWSRSYQDWRPAQARRWPCIVRQRACTASVVCVTPLARGLLGPLGIGAHRGVGRPSGWCARRRMASGSATTVGRTHHCSRIRMVSVPAVAQSGLGGIAARRMKSRSSCSW